MTVVPLETNLDELRAAFGSQKAKETPSIDSRESLIFGIYDRLTDRDNCVADVVLVPADENGEPDLDRADPANVESLPADEWPQDEQSAKRACVIVSNIAGCHEDSTFLVLIKEDGEPVILHIHGPESDCDIAHAIIGRDIGAAPVVRPPSKLAESMTKLREELFSPKPEPVAANDNAPRHDVRLAPYHNEFGGEIRGKTLFGAKVGGKPGQITFMENGEAWFFSATSAMRVELSVPAKPIAATPFSLGDPAEIPEREWLYGRHFIRRYATASVGPGGGGKTAHSISEALSMVTGRPLLDPEGALIKPLRVWWVNAEDPVDEINRRFHGAAKHFNVTNEQIGGRLFTDSGRDQSFVIARQEGRDLKIVEPFVEDIVSEIRRREIDVVIIDPFVSTHEAQENDNGAMQRVAAAWVRVADEANCCVELVHHVAKNQGEVTADSARGGGAFKDKVRSMRVFNIMTQTEADKAGVEDPRAYFRVDHGKVNMVASGRSQWRRFVSVPLNNGRGLVKTGDEIGVVEAWRWPSADVLADRAAEERQAAVAGVAAETLHGLKARLLASDYKADQRARYWAGNLLVELGVARDKDHAKAMLAAWIEAGELEIVRMKDASRHEADFIKPVAAV